ncbi:MAG: hypothetical protein AB8G05_07190 [Oligoflexales bacterium]
MSKNSLILLSLLSSTAAYPLEFLFRPNKLNEARKADGIVGYILENNLDETLQDDGNGYFNVEELMNERLYKEPYRRWKPNLLTIEEMTEKEDYDGLLSMTSKGKYPNAYDPYGNDFSYSMIKYAYTNYLDLCLKNKKTEKILEVMLDKNHAQTIVIPSDNENLPAEGYHLKAGELASLYLKKLHNKDTKSRRFARTADILKGQRGFFQDTVLASKKQVEDALSYRTIREVLETFEKKGIVNESIKKYRESNPY